MRWRYILQFAAIPFLAMSAIALLGVLLLVPHSPAEGTAGNDAQAQVVSQDENVFTLVGIEAPAQVAEGKSFTARVSITNVTGFDACNYDVSYDSLVLAVTDVAGGDLDGGPVPVEIWEEVSPGTVRVVQNVPGVSGVSGSGYLAEMLFEVVGSAGDTSCIELQNGVWGDNDAQAIPVLPVPASVDISTALQAGFMAGKTEALAGQTLTVTDTSSGGTPPYTYSWDFDDDGIRDSTAANPSPEYAAAGTYTVTLTVTDGLGDTATKTIPDYIVVHPRLDVDFTVSEDGDGEGIPVLAFADTTSGGKSPNACAWDLDNDGQTDSTASSPTYTYNAAGTHPVRLTVTDALGNSSTRTNIVFLYPLVGGDELTATEITEIERSVLASDGSAEGSTGEIGVIIIGFG